MSRHRRNKQAVIQRATIPVAQPTSGNMVTLPASVWAAMMQHFAPQKNVAETFSPGAPLKTIPGITPATGPRQFAFMPGYNLAGNDRTLLRTYIQPFEQLRLLAQTYSTIGIAERIWLDLVPAMKIIVTLTDQLKAQGKDDKDFQEEITGYRTFFEKIDGADDIHTTLRKCIVEQTQIDALWLFKRKTRGGKLEGLDIVDGTIMKPLLDERGRTPVPPYAAYQQYAYGTPGAAYTTNDFIYYRESPRTFSPYGFSRVERIVTIVNMALRKQTKDLARFTEGTIPAGIMEVPDTSTWTPDQIDAYEQAWNSLLAGNAQQQVRVKFTQPGMKYTAFDQYEANEHLTEFDDFLNTVTLGVYGVSKADAAFTGDIHKSADQGQQNMLYRRTVGPLDKAYAGIFTRILHEDIGDTRFVVKFGGYEEEEDVQTQVSTFSIGIQNAMISPSDAAAKLGWPDIPKTGPIFVTKAGITPLANYELGSEMRTASDTAQMAGLQLAANPQPQEDGEDEDDDSESQSSKGKPPVGGQKSKNGKPASNGSVAKSQEPQQDEKRYTIAELLALLEKEPASPGKEAEVERAAAITAKDLAVELNIWRGRAVDDMRRARPFRGFSSIIIPEVLHSRIEDELEGCQSVMDVKAVFARAKSEETIGAAA